MLAGFILESKGYLRLMIKSVHFKKTVAQSSFLSKVLSFLLTFFSFCKNDITFERNEDRVTFYVKMIIK